MAKQSSLLACPDDIFLIILEQCEQSSIHNLSLTSKSIRPRCIPQLYRKVDLSSHNLGRIHEYEDEVHMEMWANMDDSNGPENMLSRQRAFLRTMTKSPKYAPYVRVFSWTLIWYDQYDEQDLTEIDYQLWAVFSRLDRVEQLDLAALAQDKPLEEYTRQIPSVLFPLVTELRLTGWMTHKLVANIFNSINLSQLRVLSLDALQEEGNLPDGSPMPEDINAEHWDSGWRAKLCKSRTTGAGPTDFGIIFPGPMWLTFVPLIGELDSLQHLEIRIPPLEEARMGDDCPEYVSYIAVMAELVEAAAPNLKKLIIDYARGKRGANVSAHTQPGIVTLQHNRLRRSEVILKSFLSPFWSNDEWKWKSLRSVSLKGFLQSTQLGPPSREGEDQRKIQSIHNKIEDCLSTKGIILEWSDDSPRPAFLFLGHDHGVSDEAMERFNQIVEQVEQS